MAGYRSIHIWYFLFNDLIFQTKLTSESFFFLFKTKNFSKIASINYFFKRHREENIPRRYTMNLNSGCIKMCNNNKNRNYRAYRNTVDDF